MCDTLVVVWPDGVGFAKNSDRDPNEAQRLEWKPAASHDVNSSLRCTWITIPQVRRTYAVLLSRPFWMWGAEMGANDAGVVIGNEAVFTRSRLERTGLTGMDLVRLGLERAGSAKQAVDVITQLIQQYGQGGRAGYSNPKFSYHNSFLIADHQGAAVLEAVGREVAVEWIDQGVRAISNGLTIPTLLDRSDRLRGRVAECHVRRSRMEQIGQSASGPDGLIRALRDHGGDIHWGEAGLTERQASSLQLSPPRYRRLNGALSAPCVHYGGILAGSQTVASWVSCLSANGARHWATGTSAPCISIFRPISLEHPQNIGSPEGHPDSTSLWWRFEKIHRWLLHDWSAASDLATERDDIERIGFGSAANDETLWKLANEWLNKWEQQIGAIEDRRPNWLKRRWAKVVAEAAEGNRLPPR